MKIINYTFAFALLLVFVAGCGNPTVTGKVTFPDGTPLTRGEVIFESGTMQARGLIGEDGTYTMESGEQRGIPRGTYQVFVGGFSATVVPSNVPGGRPQVIPPTIPIARKYTSPSDSGLVVEVRGRTRFDFTVSPPE